MDAVIVATPDHWHAPAAILACDAGKDVYVEKPVSHNLREGRLLVDAARRKHNRVVQAGMQSRSRPSTIKAIESRAIGRAGTQVLMAKAWNSQLRDDIGKADQQRLCRRESVTTRGLGLPRWFRSAPTGFITSGIGTGISAPATMGNDGAHQIDQARWASGCGAAETREWIGREVLSSKTISRLRTR